MENTTPFLMPKGITERQTKTFSSYLTPTQGPLETDCLIWTGSKTKPDWRGYAIYKLAGSPAFVLHRRLWKDHIDPNLADELDLDHLCRNRACINLNHLEPVTRQVNVAVRGVGLSAQNLLKTHCPAGHEYTTENTYLYKGRYRHCRECVRVRSAAWRKKVGYNTNTKTRTDGK